MIKNSSERGVRLEDGRSVGPVLQGGHMGDARSRHSGQTFPHSGGRGLYFYPIVEVASVINLWQWSGASC